MDRRNFLQQLGPVGTGALLAPGLLSFDSIIKGKGPDPRFLNPGDFIGITCPAGSIDLKDARYCEVMLAQWGLRTKIGNTVGKNWQNFAGTDEERASDFQRMIDDPVLKAIIFGRGGYGTMRMMDKIDWQNFSKNPKWLIGYSDATAIHCHIHTKFNIPTIHARMAGGFGTKEDESEISLKNALLGQPINYEWGSHPLNREGKATGLLVGGNLSLIHAMQASESELDTKGKILFIEDVSEYKYTIDRMLIGLKRSGKLNEIAGLLVGGFTGTKLDGEGYFSASMEDIILEKVKEFNFPVSFGFPAGHQTPNLAIKLGINYNLYVGGGGSSLSEIPGPNPLMPAPILDSIPPPKI